MNHAGTSAEELDKNALELNFNPTNPNTPLNPNSDHKVASFGDAFYRSLDEFSLIIIFGGCSRVFLTVQCSTLLSRPFLSDSEILHSSLTVSDISPTLCGFSAKLHELSTSNPFRFFYSTA